MPKWRSGKTTGLRIGQYSRRARVRVPVSAIFFFFFFNIHTSNKVESFFDHSILVNGVDPWGIHRFLGGKKTVYTPWVNAMSAAFTGTE